VVLNLTGVDAGWKLGFFPVPPGNPRAKVVPGVAKEERGDRPENRTLILPIRDKGVPGAVWKGVIVATDATGKQLAWEVDSSVPSSVPSPASTSAEVPRTTVAAQTDALLAVEEESKPFLWIAFLAFLGGIALNFTPCVLPVISLKIFGFVEMAGESKDKVFRYGAAFSAGVIAFFLALAVLAISLRGALNWGAQFQNPYALTPIIAIIFLFGLSMCGVFEFELPGSVMNRLGAWAQGDGLAGTFAHGFTTTLLGASCTAPLLSLPLGYGFSATAHPVAIVAVFALMGVGMTLPYFLLSLRTEWLRYLPKPGAWMKRFKQTLGFVMLAVAVWLLGAVGAIAQVQGLVKVLFFLLSLGIAAWMYGTWFEKPWVLPASALVAVAAWFAFVQGQLRPGQGAPTARAAAQSETWENGITWQPWSRAGVEGAVRDGKVAFVDFTAEWCANCKFIEKTVLNTPEVGAAFKAANVVAFKADWTDENPDITAELKRLGRAAVPVYVVFYPGRPGKILAELPGKAEIIAAVSKP
jgi:thiol:disulfide interchange protein DsbD